MRKLLLMRGVPGCGKSTFLRENGLDPYTISPDTLRLAHSGPVYDAAGGLRIPADNDKVVWQQLFELLEKRMYRGELVAVDATHTHPRSFGNYQQLARNHRYQVVCVDFADVPFETCMERNLKREAFRQVPRLEMERMYGNLQRSIVPKWIVKVPASDLMDFLHTEPKDVSEYKKIHHIGDLQGCFDPLAEYFETHGFFDDELYIFVGDYLDRGTQNAQVMQWLLENYQRPNLVFVEGNHERHLRTWAKGGTPRSREFNDATRPQLEGANIAPKKVYGFLYRLREMFYYRFHDRTVLVTHGGLSTLPGNLALVHSAQLVKGAGVYEEADEADATFAATAPKKTYQVHGHRNRYASPLRVNDRCFNLEGKIEFGGELRTVTLTKKGFEERCIKSNIDATATILEPVGAQWGKAESVADMLKTLRASRDIYEKPQKGTNISSFNFTREVFYNKAWDALNVHARGLFINTKQEVIVARAYEKFFNVGERPETQPDTLMRSLKFPVRAWIKENGYLGLVGYDPETDQLVFASKSSLTSDFAGWFKAQFEALLADARTRQELELYIKSEGGKTLVFEVIDPINDPHIITYRGAKLVLLDIVKNSLHFQAKDADERKKVAALLGVQTKQVGAVLKDAAAFEGWLKAVQHFDYQHNNERIEGFVLEDSDGFMAKVKLPWYGFWRQMRTQLERLQHGKKTRLPALDIQNELAEAFLAYVGSKEPAHLESATIITLRQEFETQSTPLPKRSK